MGHSEIPRSSRSDLAYSIEDIYEGKTTSYASFSNFYKSDRGDIANQRSWYAKTKSQVERHFDPSRGFQWHKFKLGSL